MVRSAAAVVAGNCLVAATLIDSWLPWRTSSSGNQTGLPSTGEPPSPPVMGDPPQGATSTSTTSVWWGEWNFRVLLGWTNLMVFSTPEQKGSLGTDGGWALYLLDKVGVISFGRYWPVAGWTALATLVIGLLTALVWSLKACEKWFCCGCGCRRRGPREGVHAVDPALRHLPVTTTPVAYAPVTLVGPGSATAVDTEYYQRQVRGRGAGRRPHDLVLRFPQGAVRMQPDWTHRTRIDRHGLWIKPGRILGVTARALREHLERADQIHLCRAEDCAQPGAYHCKEFAAIDADSVIDLGAYGRLDGWRALVLFWRGRYPRTWLQEFLYSAPTELEERGLVLTKGAGSEGDEFGTPPRTASRGASIGEAVALVASAYNIGPEIVQMSVLGALEGTRDEGKEEAGIGKDPLAWSERRPSLTGLQAPPPPLPPGLAQESSLVQARVTPPDNHLLASSDGLPEAVARLFPTPGSDATSGLVSAATGTLSLHQPSLGLGQGLVRKAGASFGEQLGPSDPTLATDRIIHAIDGLRKAQDEDKTGTKGQVSSIKEGEKLEVFLARGCGQLSIELCKGVYGKELFHSIKRAGLHAKHELSLIKWPVLITNRVALSIAGMWWGGTENFTLLAADCATARVEQIENWSPPTEHKIEARGKAPTTFLTWLRYAENSIKVFGSAYGLEHVRERNKFLQALREAQEEDENAFPFTYCVQLFEEMTAVWCEEICESRRRLCAKLGTENPRLEDFKLIALSPGATGQANFQFPRVWDLADPAGYYQRVILPRQNKAMARLLNKQLQDHVTKEKRPDHRKTAGPLGVTNPSSPDAPSPEVEDTDKIGRAPRLALRSDPNKAGDALKAYPAGKRLSKAKAHPKAKAKAIDYGHPQLAEEAQEVLSSIGAKAGLNLPEPEARFDPFTWTEGVGRGQMTFNHPMWEGVPPLDIFDAQDKLTLPDDLRVALQLEQAEEMRQCLCLHVALAFEGDFNTAWEQARDLRRELWEVKQLLEIATQGARVIRELEVDGWGSFLETQEERVGEALFEKASEYLDLCGSAFSVDKAQQAGRLGAELISSAGTVEKAVHVLNTVRVQKLGDHLAGAKKKIFKGISPLHQEYFQVCAQDGVPSRREKSLAREEAKNHGSVYGYEEELLQKAWKDAAYGAALFVDPEVGEVSQLLDQAKVAESPLGRVPKQNPDRTISSEGRPINDMRRQNDAGSKFNHPPAPQPRHHAVARQSLWWRARHPGVPQKCAKRDVPRAFKWHFLRAKDVPEFAVKLAGLLILSLAMPFGWVGSPGEFVAWSAAARAHHGSFRPADPRFNDVVPFESKWLMDDGVVVEPMVGNRVFDSLAVLDETMQLVWGPEGVNVEKMAEEGEPSTTQLLWGLHMNFDTQEVRLPEPKRIKAKYLLGETALQRGCREVPLRLLQELIGCAQYWTVACPALTPHLPTLYHLLKGNLQGNKGSGGKNTNNTLVQVEACSHAEEDRRWEDFWDALDFIRLQLEAPLQCSFVSVFEKLLPIRERLALPGVTARARITGGDATLDRIGAVDWKDKVFHADKVDQYREGLRSLAREGDETDIISVMELLAFVVLACHRRAEWTGELVLYVTDNMNVRTWLHKRRPRNRASSLLIRLAQRLESENHFTVHPVYIRTYRNQLADWLSREDLQLVRKQLAADGWTEVATGLQWEEFLRDAERSALVYPTGDDPKEMQFDSTSLMQVAEKFFPNVETGVPPKCLVHKVTGPACAFVGPTKDIKGPGATLIPSGTGAARKLSLGEIARAQGLTATQWTELVEVVGQEEALRKVVQEPGWQVAAAILGLWQDEPLKAGNCLDPEEEAARQQLEVWLQAWKVNPERPREMLDLLHTQTYEGPIQEPTLWPDAGDTRVGGRTAKDPEDRKLVTPVLLGEERDRFFTSVGLPGENLLHQLDQTGQEAVLSKLADSTRRSYGAGWKQWATFMSGTGVPPFLQGETRTEKQADEEWLIRFVVFLHQRMGRTAQGIKQRLSGIRYAHIAAGYPDPLEKAAVWASICLGWFYMLRASEYLPGIVALNAPSRVLRGATAMLAVTSDVETVKRFGGWKSDAESAPSSYHAAVPVPPVQESADEPLNAPQLFLPEQVFHSPSWRSALPHAVMADNAPRPAGMGHAQLREWIEQWGSAWAFLGLQPGSSMTDVMKAFKKKALVLHPDKVPESEKADATLRMSALGNAKEILLSPGLRILHDNLLGLGGTAPPHAPGAPPPSSSAAPPQPEPAPPPDPFSGYDYTWFEKGKGKGPWRQKGRNVWEEGFESDDSWELDSDSSGSAASVAITNNGVKAGALAAGGSGRTAGGGARASTDPPPEPKKAPPPPPPSGDGGPQARPAPPREGFFDTWWCYNCKAKVSTHALKCPTCNRQRGDNRSWRNAGTNRPEYKAPPKARPSSPPPSAAPDASQAPPPRPTKAPPAGAHRPSAAGPPPFKAAPKPPPPAAFSNTLHWVCGTCGEVNGLHRYGCNTCSTSQHAEGNIHEHATHWICPHCQDEVSVKRTVCDCGKWRPRSAPLINHGQAAEDHFVAKGATAARVVLNRKEVVNQGAGLGLEEPPTEGLHPAPTLDQVDTTGIPEEVVEVEDDEMGVTPQGTDDTVVPTHADVAAMDVDEPEVVSAYTPPTTKTPGIPAKAYPGQTVWCPPQSSHSMMSTTSRPISYSPGDFIAEPAPEPEHEGSLGTGATASGHPGPDPVPKKARGPVGDTRPLAIVLPNGEALWFTTRDIDADTPRLVIPWSLFQYIAMSKRPLSGFQSWGKVGVLYIRRVAQDILHGAQQRCSIMDRIREANRSNPLLLDLNSAYPEPHDATPPISACTGAHRPSFNFRDFLQRPHLGGHFGPGEGPPRAGRGALPCIYNQPSHEMPLAASIGEADHASNCMGLWAQRLLGQENPSPPAKGVPPKATSEAAPSPTTPPPTAHTAEPAPEEVEDDEESDVELTVEEREEVARIEEECSALERRMRDLSVTQQRSLLENLANASSAVIGGLLADTVRRTAQMRSKGAKGGGRTKVKANQASANKDPKYLEDLSKGLSHAEAFVRHRSRLRAIQHQMEYGDVSLQPRATQVQTDRPLPPMLSLGKAHRLSLLGRLHRLEQQGVTWTQEDVDRCLTMERFLDYLENRESHRPGGPSDAPGTASKSAGAPPPWDSTETGVGRTALVNPPWDAVLYRAKLYLAFDYNRCRSNFSKTTAFVATALVPFAAKVSVAMLAGARMRARQVGVMMVDAATWGTSSSSRGDACGRQDAGQTGRGDDGRRGDVGHKLVKPRPCRQKRQSQPKKAAPLRRCFKDRRHATHLKVWTRLDGILPAP
ncbi:hypothetical protein AK812_SmicGene287 [Symbiodinium microadriaticum]|uniref:J domain-containing protein n=1 Tax=Symbiodinium microadriaticum TaxID=2951 RepID=A0A1Q9F6Y0_SYMMI|nr:hypothetical protein AK812_SmicGene287 [Symbiodinium microadriaticum]